MLLNTERALVSGLIRHLQKQLDVTEHRCFAIAITEIDLILGLNSWM